jgi:hypothetical protein
VLEKGRCVVEGTFLESLIRVVREGVRTETKGRKAVEDIESLSN